MVESEKSPIVKLAGLTLFLSCVAAVAAEPPRATISNGLIRATLYLPDARDGYYRGTRFDWSGVISSLEYKGHNYFGEWFDRRDPNVSDIDFSNGITAGPNSAATGPVEEFFTDGRALGYDEAKAGGTFIKIGVGVLRKPEEKNYDHYRSYEIVDPGKWTVRKSGDRVEFIQALSDGAGNGYVYRKVVRLAKGSPEMVLEHSLKNTGRRPIDTSVYDHNFFTIDKQTTGPDLVVTFPFDLRGARPMGDVAEVRGKQLVYLRTLAKDDRAFTTLEGYGAEAKDYDIRVENRKTGAGVRVTGDRPITRLVYWSIRTVLSPEAYMQMHIEPGQSAEWRLTYRFYTLPQSESK
jgi:hypothetical protein